MIPRDKFRRTIGFNSPERPFMFSFSPRPATIREWRKQGLPANAFIESRFPGKRDYSGLTNYFNIDGFFDETMCLNYNDLLNPPNETKVLEEMDNYKVVIDHMGATVKVFSEDENPGFVTHQWLKFPVETDDDYEKLRRRFNPGEPDRYMNDIEIFKKMNRADMPKILVTLGLFSYVRDFMGFENGCMAFLDNPALVEKMMEDRKEFTLKVLTEIFKHQDFDMVVLHEDMAFKGRLMISPDMIKRFMAPHYRAIADLIHAKGARFYVDSDGCSHEAIGIWIESGVDGTGPLEIASGMDPVRIRKEFGKNFFLIGGLDKQAIAKTRQDIDDEVMKKVSFLYETGGYLPCIDHGIPFDVPLENFKYLCSLLNKLASGK